MSHAVPGAEFARPLRHALLGASPAPSPPEGVGLEGLGVQGCGGEIVIVIIVITIIVTIITMIMTIVVYCPPSNSLYQGSFEGLYRTIL